MGKSISSIVAERYMLHLEERIWNEANHLPGLYLRWVDDTLSSWDYGLELLQNDFVPFLNSLDPDLEWTVEVEKNKSINFLDATILRFDDRLETTVYRKACNTRHFVPAASNHPWEHKVSAMHHAFRRALKYCSTPALQRKETAAVYDMFLKNGYSKIQLNEAKVRAGEQVRQAERLAELRDQEPASQEDHPADLLRIAPHDFPIKIGLPYIGPWSKRMQKLGRKYGIFFALSNSKTVRRAFPSPKVPQSASLLGGTVYLLKCLCPDGSERPYVGQTGGPLTTRTEQHKSDWTKGTGSFNRHLQRDGHDVLFDDIVPIAAEEIHPIRVVTEALYILGLTAKGQEVIDNPNLAERDGRRVNKSDGLRLSPLWQPVAKRL